jgi:hypothetical protein
VFKDWKEAGAGEEDIFGDGRKEIPEDATSEDDAVLERLFASAC